MNGFELLDAIRSSEQSQCAVLLLSARAGDEARAEGIEAGADDYLVKPFAARELYARVTTILQKRALTRALESAVEARTSELEASRNESLISRQLAENALYAKSRFLFTVSHEMRTPMAGIISMAELLTLEDLGDSQNIASRAIFDSAKRLLQMVNNLLDVADSKSGSIKLEKRFFPIGSVLGDVRQLVANQAESKQIRLIGNYDSDIPEFVCGDELRVRQVLLSLVENAIKFTDSGQVEIKANGSLSDRLGIIWINSH